MAGKIGFAFQTTGALRNTIKNVGTKFDLRTAHIPLIDPVNGRLPTGGNAVVILTKDADKQAAAWKFAKFAAGPYGASVVVPGTGYVPNNELAAEFAGLSRDLLQGEPAVSRRSRANAADEALVCLPGQQRRQGHPDHRRESIAIIEQSATPQEALDDAAADVEDLLPRS